MKANEIIEGVRVTVDWRCRLSGRQGTYADDLTYEDQDHAVFVWTEHFRTWNYNRAEAFGLDPEEFDDEEEPDEKGSGGLGFLCSPSTALALGLDPQPLPEATPMRESIIVTRITDVTDPRRPQTIFEGESVGN